jgi:hypothetical protein
MANLRSFSPASRNRQVIATRSDQVNHHRTRGNRRRCALDSAQRGNPRARRGDRRAHSLDRHLADNAVAQPAGGLGCRGDSRPESLDPRAERGRHTGSHSLQGQERGLRSPDRRAITRVAMRRSGSAQRRGHWPSHNRVNRGNRCGSARDDGIQRADDGSLISVPAGRPLHGVSGAVCRRQAKHLRPAGWRIT